MQKLTDRRCCVAVFRRDKDGIRLSYEPEFLQAISSGGKDRWVQGCGVEREQILYPG